MKGKVLSFAAWVFIVLIGLVLVTGCLGALGVWGRIQGAPLPFPKPHIWGPDPVGTYVMYQGGVSYAEITLRRDGTARYGYHTAYKKVMLEPFKNLRWERHPADSILLTEDGITRYWLHRPGKGDRYEIRRVR